ncbi:MAG: transporter ATP-binding protein [Bacillales bacterium]|jgi:ATPase subunit of ABC transporter with duplicated ATPase domains|nr:transporter ATP-binding protein [Bacillales bacterium]
MNICSVKDMKKIIGGNIIFDNLSFEINEKEKIGLVGRNGTGKTTIFKILSGQEPKDNGEIHFKKGTQVGYLSQIPNVPVETLVIEFLQGAFKDLYEMKQKMTLIEEQLANLVDENEISFLMKEYGKLQDVFIQQDGYEMDSKIQKVVNGLKINHLQDKFFDTLSGGEKTKVCLAFILLSEPDLLLLDEPTNHLDISSIEWLEKFIREYEKTVIIVSHDRYFLDEVVTKIYDLEDGEITVYHSNYSKFAVDKNEKLLKEFNAYKEQQKKIKKIKEAIKRLREWANQANPPNEGLHRRANNMQRALDRMEKLKKPIIEAKKIDLQFEQSNRSGKNVISLDGVSKQFSERMLFKELSLDIYYRDRACIIGDNGTGKSTVLKIIMGEQKEDSGVVKVGSSVKVGYLSQNISEDNREISVLRWFVENIPVSEEVARHILARFLFYGGAVFKKLCNLSGGERMRLQLAKLMHDDINLLLLDEPTNHLDIDTREVLEDALEDFGGTIVAVSHDRFFLNKLFNKTYYLKDSSLFFYNGNYDYAKKKYDEHHFETTPQKEVREKVQKPRKSNDEKILRQLEDDINLLELQITDIDKQIESTNNYNSLSDLISEKEKLLNQLDYYYNRLDEIC